MEKSVCNQVVFAVDLIYLFMSSIYLYVCGGYMDKWLPQLCLLVVPRGVPHDEVQSRSHPNAP